MADDHNAKLGAAFVAVLGALWLTLTGLCTWSLGHGSELNGMWPIGLFCMAPGTIRTAASTRDGTSDLRPSVSGTSPGAMQNSPIGHMPFSSDP